MPLMIAIAGIGDFGMVEGIAEVEVTITFDGEVHQIARERVYKCCFATTAGQIQSLGMAFLLRK